MADQIDSQLVRKPDDTLHFDSHVLRIFYKSISRPERANMVQRVSPFRALPDVRFQRLSTAMEHFIIFRYKSRHRNSRRHPGIGKPMVELLRNGDDVTTATLTRFFGLHVAVLPAIFTVVLGIHLLFIQVQGISEPESWKDLPESKRRHIPFFPNFVMRDVLLWLIVLNVLAILAVFFPWELGNKADPFASAPMGIRPEWYFLFMFQSLKFFPAKILTLDGEVVGVSLFGLAGLLWFLIPFWDSKTPKGSRNKIINYAGIGVVLYMIVLTIIGAR